MGSARAWQVSEESTDLMILSPMKTLDNGRVDRDTGGRLNGEPKRGDTNGFCVCALNGRFDRLKTVLILLARELIYGPRSDMDSYGSQGGVSNN